MIKTKQEIALEKIVESFSKEAANINFNFCDEWYNNDCFLEINSFFKLPNEKILNYKLDKNECKSLLLSNSHFCKWRDKINKNIIEQACNIIYRGIQDYKDEVKTDITYEKNQAIKQKVVKKIKQFANLTDEELKILGL